MAYRNSKKRKNYVLKYNKKYYKKNQEKIITQSNKYYANNKNKVLKRYKNWYEKNKKEVSMKNYKNKKDWIHYLKSKTPNPKCEICGKSLKYGSGNQQTSVAFDHKQRGILIKSPADCFNLKCTLKRIAIWESCNFGMLCCICNVRLPTDNRKQWLKQVIKYVNK